MIHPARIHSVNRPSVMERLHDLFVEDARPLSRTVAAHRLAKESGWFRAWLRERTRRNRA